MPRIAIPVPHSGDPEYAERALPQYLHAVEMAGGEPVRIPLDRSPAEVMKLIERCDGVVLPGSKADGLAFAAAAATAGAAAIAAVLNRKLPLQGKRVAVLVCGGNIDVTLLARIIERGLVKDGRLVRLRVHLPDYPGALHRLTGILADHRANIVETAYDRAYHGVNLGDTAIDITMETRGPDHIAELLSALSDGGYSHERVL